MHRLPTIGTQVFRVEVLVFRVLCLYNIGFESTSSNLPAPMIPRKSPKDIPILATFTRLYTLGPKP